MEGSNRQAALKQLLTIAASNGYVTFDDMIHCADDNSLSIGELDWLAEMAGARNLVIYDETPKRESPDDDEFDDYAQSDYERTFMEAVEMCPMLDALINDIRNIMPPQRGEVGRLKYQVKEGNVHARERMTEMYLRLAVRIAVSKAKAYDLDLEETVGDAFVGLLIAVDKYDPDYSGPFSSFASLWIYQNISKEQSTRNPNIYFPVHRKEVLYSVYPLLKSKGCTDCERLFQCKKAVNMICEKALCNFAQARDILAASVPSLSLDKMDEHDEEDLYLGYSDEEMLDEIDIKFQSKELHRALDHLTPRQREVLTDRYGLKNGTEKTLEQVGQKYGLTRERIRQIENKALRRLANLYSKYRDA